MPGVKFGRGKRKSAADGSLLPLAPAAEEGTLFGSDASWSDLWRGMPAYEMGSTEAHRKVTVHLRDEEEVAEFGRMIGVDLTGRTETVWLSKDEDYVAPKELLYAGDDPRPPRYPVYVISKGRWETPLTAEALRAIGVPHKVVVEPSEAERYADALGEDRIVVAPEDFSKRNQGGIPVRNYVWELALATGARRHWILDDNVRGFLRLHRNRRIPVGSPAIFRAAEDFTDRYENVAFSGFNYMYLAPDRGKIPPFYLNTRVYSMILVDNSLDLRWRGRYNEDTDICLRALKAGYATVLFNAFLGDKVPTLTMKGGNASIYAESDNRRAFAESLKEQHPDVVEVVWRYGRWHHEVDYRPFAGNRLIPRRDRPLDGGEYGMKLVRERRESRYVAAAPTTVMLAPKRESPSREERGEIPNVVDEPVPVVTFGVRGSRVSAPAPTKFEPRASAASVPLSDPFVDRHAAVLAAAGDARLTFDAWDYNDASPAALDVECFPNFFLVMLKRVSSGAKIAFELSDRSRFARETLSRALGSARLVTFNGTAYDLPLVALALDGASNERLKVASDRIVRGNLKPWDVERELDVKVPRLDHVDLLEANPSVRQSLKVLAARLHARFLVDLPFDPSASLSPREMNVATLYCANDLDVTTLLFDALREPYELRRSLSNEYRTDLRSRSDAQIGEAIVKLRAGVNLARPAEPPASFSFRYSIPGFLSFETDEMRAVLRDLAEARFDVTDGKVAPPESIDGREVRIGETVYVMGIGGLHSTEAHRALRSDGERQLVDLDVASQYPSIIAKLGLYPRAIGPRFLEVYGALLAERLAAKAAGEKVKSDGLKIALNGVFGKLGSPYSPLYAPDLMVAVTLTGQLSLLMLIERAERAGIAAVSGNTDGVVLFAPRSRLGELDAIVASWEEATGFRVERTPYRALYSSSVNTYLALKEDGSAKRKGAIADPWSDGDLRGQMMKNPQMEVLSEAVLRLARDGTPVEETIASIRDPRMFITAIRVTGGAIWRGAKLGRVVRYYWSTDGEPIVYANASRKVAKTDGARPLMELTDALPPDLDTARYVAEAKALAEDLAIVDPETGLLA